jgi:microcystin-dependent protein
VSENYLGEIMLWPMSLIPNGWELCDGRALAINEYSILFDLINTKYGGDGVTSFRLPDLRSRLPIGAATLDAVGTQSGSDSATASVSGQGLVSLSIDTMPAHSHVATFSPSSDKTASLYIPAVKGPTNTVDAPSSSDRLCSSSAAQPYSSDPTNTQLKPFSVSLPLSEGSVSIESVGEGQQAQVSDMALSATLSVAQPSLAINYIICVEGIYPPRS